VAAKIRKGDTVEVITGKSRGQRGTVRSIDTDRVTVERVNMVWKHQKPSPKSPGGRLEQESPVDVSNVMLIHKGERTRVAFRVVNGKKVRWSKRHGEAIDG